MTSKIARTTLPFLAGPLVLFASSQACTPEPYTVPAGAIADGGVPGGAGGVSGSSGGGATNLGGTTGNAGAAGAHGETGGGAAAGHGGAAMMGQCDPTETPDASEGVFVASSGSDTAGDGSKAHPFASLRRALVVGKAHVYLRQDTYAIAATVVIPASAVATTIDGGWDKTWQRSCTAPGKTQMLGAATTSPVLRLDGGNVTLTHLTVATADTAQPSADGVPGNSLISVHVRDGVLTIVDAVLHAGDAAPGGAAAMVMNATEATTCDHVKDCGAAMGSSTGAPGANGSFAITKDGVAIGNGSDGQPGHNGKNGTAAMPASHTCYECVGLVPTSVVAVTDPCRTAGLGPVQKTPEPGLCGCGGTGGPGGKGGYGGGASIALLITGGSTTVQGALSRLLAGAGGKGAPGTPGGNGAMGTSGTTSSSFACYTSVGTDAFCSTQGYGLTRDLSFLAPNEKQDASPSLVPLCKLNPGTGVIPTTFPGTSGGSGELGGQGGQGGPGAGGPSYGVVTLGSATVTVDDAIITVGTGGLGGDGMTRADAAKTKQL